MVWTQPIFWTYILDNIMGKGVSGMDDGLSGLMGGRRSSRLIEQDERMRPARSIHDSLSYRMMPVTR